MKVIIDHVILGVSWMLLSFHAFSQVGQRIRNANRVFITMKLPELLHLILLLQRINLSCGPFTRCIIRWWKWMSICRLNHRWQTVGRFQPTGWAIRGFSLAYQMFFFMMIRISRKEREEVDSRRCCI